VFFGKAGLSFKSQSKKNEFSKPFSKLPEKQPIEKSKQSVVTCFYCMKKGHSVDSTILGSFLFLKEQ